MEEEEGVSFWRDGVKRGGDGGEEVSGSAFIQLCEDAVEGCAGAASHGEDKPDGLALEGVHFVLLGCWTVKRMCGRRRRWGEKTALGEELRQD